MNWNAALSWGGFSAVHPTCGSLAAVLERARASERALFGLCGCSLCAGVPRSAAAAQSTECLIRVTLFVGLDVEA